MLMCMIACLLFFLNFALPFDGEIKLYIKDTTFRKSVRSREKLLIKFSRPIYDLRLKVCQTDNGYSLTRSSSRFSSSPSATF